MLTTIQSKVANYLNHYSIAKTRQLFLGFDDELLARASISRDLLQRGVEYWPWQIEDSAGNATDSSVVAIEGAQSQRIAAADVSAATGVSVNTRQPLATESMETAADKAA